jgi:RNA polymerase sigma-70 factor (ECF subfamily)
VNAHAILARSIADARPRVLAALAVRLGNIDLAEEAFAEAGARCLASASPPPRNLAAWLMTVARRHAIDTIRRRGAERRALADPARLAEMTDTADILILPEPIPDERLRLIFICCHPAIAPEARAALALKVICGLPVERIAQLFLTSEQAMYQRITRAKSKLREAGIAFELPPRKAWGERLGAVLLTLELAYTAAYADAGGSQAGNAGGELAGEIERLALMLAELLPGEPEVLGMAALVVLARSREGARLDADGAMVPLSQQDTALWDRTRIARARQMLDDAAKAGRSGPYQVMAAIQLTHARRVFGGAVDWRAILALYDALAAMRPGPVVALNRALALAQLEGPAGALDILDALSDAIGHSRPWFVARADLLEAAGEGEAACAALDRALATKPAQAERRWLESWRARLSHAG